MHICYRSQFFETSKLDIPLQHKQLYLSHHLGYTQKKPNRLLSETVQGSRGLAMGNSDYRPHANGIG